MARKSRRAEDIAAGAPSANERPMAEPGENIIPATGETFPISEDAGGAATENSVLPTAEDIQAEPDNVFSVVSGVAEREGGSPLNPDSAIVEAALTDDFEVLEEIGDESLRVVESLARPYSENFRMFAQEAADYSKSCFETRATYSKALLTAKSLENAVQFQNSYAKSAYAGLMAHLLKMNVLYFSLLGEAARQVTPLITKAYGTKT
jgi:hypothetical protein